jgi:hypothetical protein
MKLWKLSAAVLFAFVLGLCVQSCAGHLSPKVQIDRADRVAFESLHGFQLAETAAFRSGAPWPPADVHRQINAKLGAAYPLVVDVANIGLQLKPGQAIPADVTQSLATLTQTIADLVALVKPPAPTSLQAKAADAQQKTSALVITIQNGMKP